MDKENKLAPNAEPQQPTGSTVKRLARLFSTKKQSSAAPADCQGAIERTEAGSLYHRLDNTRLRGSSSSSSPGSNSRVSTAPPGSHSELGLAVGSSYERPGEVRVRPAADRKTELGPGALLAVPKLQWESPQAGAQPRLMSVKDVRASENDVCSKPTPSSLRLRPHSNHKAVGHASDIPHTQLSTELNVDGPGSQSWREDAAGSATSQSSRSIDAEAFQLVEALPPATGPQDTLAMAASFFQDSWFEEDCELVMQTDLEALGAEELAGAAALAKDCLGLALEHRARLHEMLVKSMEGTERRMLLLAAELRKADSSRDAARGFQSLSEERQRALQADLKSKDAQLLKLEADMAKMQQQQLEGRACIKATGTQSCNRGTKFEEDHFSASAWLQLLTPR